MINKRNIKTIMQWILIGVLASVMSHLLIEAFQNIGFAGETLSLTLFSFGTIMLFIVYMFLASVVGNATIGAILLLVTSFIIGIINRVKRYYRAEPLFPSEFVTVKEVPFLIEMIGWPLAILIVGTIISLIFLLYWFYKNKLKPRQTRIPQKVRWTTRLIGLLVSISSLFYISQFNMADNVVKQIYDEQTTWIYHDQLESYQKNGFIAGFLSNLPAKPMEEPPHYSKETMQQLFNKYKEKAITINQMKDAPKLNTNVIFVMNESFSDPSNLHGIESNKDPIPNYREIIQDTLSGSVLSPTFGGGTNANEFQALTGFSLEPLNPQFTSPYMQLDEGIEKYPNIVNKMNRLNYQTTAIHPYDPQFFKRDEVYQKMGFDEFFHQDNMNNQEKISDQHLYISDKAAYKEAFEVLEHSENPDFIHIVTMQNHTPYADKYEEVDYQVSGSGNQEEADAYFQDLYHSDQALTEFIHQIDKQDEPILLFFWGDHLPGLYRGDIRETHSEFTLKQTPFFIYSNTIDLTGERETMTPNYFKSYVFDLLNITVTPYEALLIDLEEKLPVLDYGFYFDTNSNQLYHSREELNEETLQVLEDYTLLMYDVTTGENYADELGFFN